MLVEFAMKGYLEVLCCLAEFKTVYASQYILFLTLFCHIYDSIQKLDPTPWVLGPFGPIGQLKGLFIRIGTSAHTIGG